MTTYTLSKTSPTNTTLVDPGGTTVYEVKTPFGLQDRTTTITRGDHVVATIQWKMIGKSTFSIDGRTSTVDAAFPRPKALSLSRVYTSASGHKFKWKHSSKLYCVSEESGLNLATCYRNPLYLITTKNSTLDISTSDETLRDELVLTWVIMEKKARDRRRATRNGGGGGGGGDGG